MKDLRVALVDIADEDTGPGGLVTLCGNASPMILTDTLGNADTPRVTFFFLPGGGQGTQAGKRNVIAQFTAWVRTADPDYVRAAEDIRDRVKDIFTATNLAAKGVDAAPVDRDWFDVEGEAEDGTLGLGYQLTFRNVE